ncbi:MAG: hypothetical protein HGA25_03965 [Clostridiales bacterium]|nr:hypothetical protein [Clostridiales bacterium]
MKKSSTIILLVAGITIILGIFLVVMSVFLIRGNYVKTDSPGNYEEKTAEFEVDSVKAITVDTSNRRIEVVESTDDLIHITYYENEKQDILESAIENAAGKFIKSQNLIIESEFKRYKFAVISFFFFLLSQFIFRICSTEESILPH